MPGIVSFSLVPTGDLQRAEEILSALGPDRPARGDVRGHWVRLASDPSAVRARIVQQLDRVPATHDWREHLVVE